MTEYQKGERVRCWPGSINGRSYLAEVISDGIVEFGGQRCYRVRKDDGGTDYMAATHVRALTDYQLGQRVRFAEHIQRKYISESERARNDPNKQWTGQAYPGKRFDGGEGVIVGKRTLSDGHCDYGYSDEPGTYAPTRHFTAWLVAFDLRRKPVHVLPEHLTPLEES